MNLVAYNNQDFKHYAQAMDQGGVYSLRSLSENYANITIAELLHKDKYVDETSNLVDLAINMANMIGHNSAINYTFLIVDNGKALFEMMPNGVWTPSNTLYDIECDKSKQVLKNAQIKAYVEKVPTFNEKEVVVFIEEFGHIHRLVMDNDGQDRVTTLVRIGDEEFELKVYLDLDKNDTKFYGVQLDIFNLITAEDDGKKITNYDLDEFIMCEIKPQTELEYLKQVIANELGKIEDYKGDGYLEGDDIDLAVEAMKEVIK